jgi:hypothetical protein
MAAGRIGPPAAATGESDTGAGRGTAGVTAVGDRLLVFRPQAANFRTLNAFDLTTIRPLWTTIGDFRGDARACGRLICLPGLRGLTAVDPDTGSTLWRNQEWDDAQPLDQTRLLATSDQAARGVAILAAATGQVQALLATWTAVADQDTGLPALLTRPDDSGGLVVAAPDPGRAASAVLGDLPDAAVAPCQAGAGMLACPTRRHTLRIWRYRP